MTDPSDSVEPPRSKLFWPLAVGGWLMIGYATRGIFMHEADTRPPQLFRLLVGLDVAHDLVLVPVVLLAGLAVTRLVPARARPPITGALFVSATVALFAYPFVRGYGRFAEYNSSRLPNNYAHGLLLVLGAVWAVAALLVVVRLRRPIRS